MFSILKLFFDINNKRQRMSGFQLPAGFKPAGGPSSGGGGGVGGQGGPSEEERAAAEDRARQQAEMKRNMISAMLSVEARERCE